MKLYTKTGDGGETSLFDGTRVGKDHPRVAAYGDLDELNAALGWCRSAPGAEAISSKIVAIQPQLLSLGAELASPPESAQAARVPRIADPQCRRLETWIDEATEAIEPLEHFVLPGGTELACRLHLARTCCRRAERSLVALARSEVVRPEVIVYLNRLSDLLFTWARLANQKAGCPDVIWVSAE